MKTTNNLSNQEICLWLVTREKLCTTLLCSPPEQSSRWNSVLEPEIRYHVLFKSSQNKGGLAITFNSVFPHKLSSYRLLKFLKAVASVNTLVDSSSVKQQTEVAVNTFLQTTHSTERMLKCSLNFTFTKCVQRGRREKAMQEMSWCFFPNATERCRIMVWIRLFYLKRLVRGIGRVTTRKLEIY